MLELNKVMLIGNLTRDPELSYLPSGTALAKLGVAVNRRYKDRNGESKDDVAFIDVETWAKSAEFCAKYLKKGRRVFIEGRLRQDRWESPDGGKRNRIVVNAERVQFADSRPSEDGGSSGGASGQYQPPESAPPSPWPGTETPAHGESDAPSAMDGQADEQQTADDLPF
ncbi:single-stranded DNA-binding protein [Candidatus Sumerlaeota bacterium]|nr:single-stranded DNA-binding protein [Candidatus Sumerlaeota bacterium]